MGANVKFSIEPAEALRLGLAYFDIYILNWGAGSGIDATTSGLVYPLNNSDLTLPAPRGIMIHPESDFDRVLVETSVGSGVPDAATAKSTVMNRLTYTVAVDSPLILSPPTLPLPANGVVPASTVRLRCHPNAIYHASYAKSGTAALAAFNTAVIPLTGDVPRLAFNAPILVLRFFLQTPPMPLLRAPQVFPRSQSNYNTVATYDSVVIDAAEAPGEQLFAIIPIHGRRCVTPIFRAIDCTPRVRVAVNDFDSLTPTATPAAGGGRIQMERTLVTTDALVSNVPVQASYAPSSDWLMLYYTPSDGDDGLLMWQVRLSP